MFDKIALKSKEGEEVKHWVKTNRKNKNESAKFFAATSHAKGSASIT